VSRIDLVSELLLIRPCNLTKVEKNLLEINLFALVYEELHKIFKQQYERYFKLIPFIYLKDEDMLTVNFIQEMLKDILSTSEYTMSGVANYTNIPEEVLFDIILGTNTNPTFELSRKLFELHMVVRRELYRQILNKVITKDSSKKD